MTQRVVYGLMTVVPLLTAASGVGMLVIAGRLTITDQGAISAPHTGHLAASMVIVALIVIHLGAVLYHERKLGEPVMIRMGVAPEADRVG
jgi:cytochrome b561